MESYVTVFDLIHDQFKSDSLLVTYENIMVAQRMGFIVVALRTGSHYGCTQDGVTLWLNRGRGHIMVA